MESLLNVSFIYVRPSDDHEILNSIKANPKLAYRKDDDERLPIHWAVSYGHLDIAILLASQKNFDPDVQVCVLYIYS